MVISELAFPDPPMPEGHGSPREGGGAGTHLHPNDGVDEEKHGDQQTDIWQGLVGRKAMENSAGGPGPHAACCTRAMPGLAGNRGCGGKAPWDIPPGALKDTSRAES